MDTITTLFPGGIIGLVFMLTLFVSSIIIITLLKFGPTEEEESSKEQDKLIQQCNDYVSKYETYGSAIYNVQLEVDVIKKELENLDVEDEVEQNRIIEEYKKELENLTELESYLKIIHKGITGVTYKDTNVTY